MISRSRFPRRTVVTVLGTVLTTALLGAPAAEAAKVKIGGGTVKVSSARVAAIGVANPNRSAAKGTLTLNWQGAAIGRKSFKIPARAMRQVKVTIAKGAYDIMQGSGTLKVSAVAKAKGKGSSKKGLTLTPAGAGTGGGNQSAPPPSPAAPWADGRWQGTYAENNVDLAFNIVGTRLYTGPFDAFYIDATCRNVDPGYTGPNQVYTNAHAIEPVEAAIGGDGRFSGSGTYRPGPSTTIPWTISGRVSGKSLTDGAFSVNYTDGYGNPCSGTTRFTAAWYGDYTL